MTPETLAACHAAGFDGQGRAWSAGEFAALLDSPHVFAVGGADAFALGRVVAAEAELLTLATKPEQRRRGRARACLAAFEQEAARRGAALFFLEVADDNTAARALYASAGYREVARRAGYYAAPGGGRVDALILQKEAGP